MAKPIDKREKLALEMTHGEIPEIFDRPESGAQKLGNALKFLADPEYYRSLRDTAPSSLGKASQGIAAATLGAPVDIANIAMRPAGLGSDRPALGSDYIGELLGADIGDAAYSIGSMLPVGPAELAMGAKAFALPLAAALGGTAIASKASQGAKLNALANVLRKERGIFAGVNAKTAPSKTEFELAHEVAQRNAALPIEQGGLGLHPDNTAMDRAKEMAGLTREDAASRAHQVGSLDFTNIPISDFKGKLIHKSPSYNGKQSSEYRLGDVGGEPVYMRKANHWGGFGTNIKNGDQLANAFADINGISEDKFGRVGSIGNRWNIDGAISDKLNALIDHRSLVEPFSQESAALFDKMYPLMKKSQAGYIPIDDLVGRLPEKIATFDKFDAPIVTLPNGQLRSRFAAFDPMQRNSANILAGGAAGAVGLNSLADLLNQEEYQ